MKNNRILLVLVVALTVVVSYFWFTRSSKTFRGELSDFAVPDTAAVDKLFLADKNGHSALLERKGPGVWTIGEFVARQDAVNGLLFTLKKMKMRAPVAKSMEQNVLRDLAGNNQRKIEIYSRGRLLKTIFVGLETPDKMGTFMLIDGSSVPFDVHIPGHRGFLQTRFITDARLWRDPALFKYDYRDIASISVKYNETPVNSFEIRTNGRNPQLYVEGKPAAADSITLFQYMNEFRNVVYEYIVTESFPEATKDSILSSRPWVEVKVTDRKGKSTLVQGFHRAAADEVLDSKGEKMLYDPDRMYALLNGKDFLLVQFYQFDRLLKQPGYFVKGSK